MDYVHHALTIRQGALCKLSPVMLATEIDMATCPRCLQIDFDRRMHAQAIASMERALSQQSSRSNVYLDAARVLYGEHSQ